MGDSRLAQLNRGSSGDQGVSGGLAGAGANGLPRVSMYQIASASLRATSTRAILDPRCLASRARVRW
jgi:hypothetical protein